MASNPLDIVSVAQAKTALRLVGDDEAHDELIAGHIKGAAEWVETQTQSGIVDRVVVEAYGKIAPSADLPICHRSHAITALGIRDLAKPGDDFIEIGDDQSSMQDGQGLTIYRAPSDGWPFRALAIRYTATTPAAFVPGDIRNAMMLLVRDFYDLRGEIRPANWAVTALLRPHKAW